MAKGFALTDASPGWSPTSAPLLVDPSPALSPPLGLIVENVFAKKDHRSGFAAHSGRLSLKLLPPIDPPPRLLPSPPPPPYPFLTLPSPVAGNVAKLEDRRSFPAITSLRMCSGSLRVYLSQSAAGGTTVIECPVEWDRGSLAALADDEDLDHHGDLPLPSVPIPVARSTVGGRGGRLAFLCAGSGRAASSMVMTT